MLHRAMIMLIAPALAGGLLATDALARGGHSGGGGGRSGGGSHSGGGHSAGSGQSGGNSHSGEHNHAGSHNQAGGLNRQGNRVGETRGPHHYAYPYYRDFGFGRSTLSRPQ